MSTSRSIICFKLAYKLDYVNERIGHLPNKLSASLHKSLFETEKRGYNFSGFKIGATELEKGNDPYLLKVGVIFFVPIDRGHKAATELAHALRVRSDLSAYVARHGAVAEMLLFIQENVAGAIQRRAFKLGDKGILKYEQLSKLEVKSVDAIDFIGGRPSDAELGLVNGKCMQQDSPCIIL